MIGVIQDILGNIIIFATVFIAARSTARRKYFWLRLAASVVAFGLIRWAYFKYLGPVIPMEIRRYCNMAAFAAFIPMAALGAAFSWELDPWAALYCGSAAYCTQHIINKVYDIISRLWTGAWPEPTHYLVYAALAATVVGLFWLAVRKQKQYKIVVDSKRMFALTVILITSAIVLDLYTFRAIRGADPMAFFIVRWYSIIAVLVNLAFQVNLVSSKRTEQELNTVRSILEAERDQYLFEKSLIDTLNVKVHDMKHRLAALDEQNREKLMEDVRPVIEDYDMRFRTENQALDVILTRKNFTCRDKGITLTCIAQGSSLAFMSEVDVYSLFGNILDNAIEAAEKLQDQEKRVISLSVEQKGYFVSIHEENYFSEKLEFEGALPRTTKADTLYHGFGMKSISMLVSRYDGSLKVTTDGDRFVLDILFPV
ncbi:MAG: GHKL domain-containing protein [Oscillospiraceae bacterium]|nr:GHKL domain-containing protein [Oscillospiraceae bacterium]